MIKKAANFLGNYFLGLHIPTEYAYSRYQRKEFKCKSKVYDVASYVGEFAEMGLCRIIPTIVELGATYYAIKEQDASFTLLFSFMIGENARLISMYASFLRNENRRNRYNKAVAYQTIEELNEDFEELNQELSDVLELEEFDEEEDEEEGEEWKK